MWHFSASLLSFRASNFQAEGFNTLGDIKEAELTPSDLNELGIESPATEAIMAALYP